MPTNHEPPPAPAPRTDLSDVETWIFDLDNTLYHVSPEMHGEIDELLGSFISEFLDVMGQIADSECLECPKTLPP